ncbi:MAG: ATP-binding protein [Rhodothermales bacterium]
MPLPRSIHRYLLYAGLVCCLLQPQAAPVYGQEALRLSPEKAISQYVFESWHEDDGLPQSSVMGIAQTPDGFLWLATDEGLVRFDGVAFDTFDKRTDDAFAINDIVTILAGRDSVLWIGTRGGGLLRYDGAFSRFDEASGLTSHFITTLYEDAAGTIWAGTYGGGLLAYRGPDGFEAYGADAGLPGDFISVVAEDPSGQLLVGTEDGIVRWDGERFVRDDRPGAPAGLISTLYANPGGRLWASTGEAGLYLLENGAWTDWTDRLQLGEGYVTDMLSDNAGSTWFAATGGRLYRLAGNGFEPFTSEKEFATNDLTSLFQDREGSLWVGSRFGGLHRLRSGKFTPLGMPEGLPNDHVASVYEAPDGSMWFGTAEGAARMRPDGTIERISTAEGLGSDEVLAIIGDRAGRVWIGTYGGGLAQWDNGRITRYTTEQGLVSDNIFALFVAPDDALWIGTDAGVGRLERGALTSITSADGLSSDFITAFAAGADGSVWIGTYDSGINRYLDGAITAVNMESGLSSDAVLALHGDAGGDLWIGTYGGGLNRLRGNDIVAVTQRQGLYNDNVYVILEDAEARLWMTCNKGVFRIDKADFERLAAGDTTAIAGVAFDRSDGLRNAEGLGGQQPAGWRSRDGRLWFTTIAGAAVIDPAAIPSNTLPPPIAITGLFIDDRAVAIDSTITIPPGSHKLRFAYTATSLINPHRVAFQTMLSGADVTWAEPTTRRESFYTNLAPGDYAFHVRARNDDGVWNHRAAKLSLYLEPYFYQTLWFRLLCLAGLIGGVFLAYRVRMLQMKARQEELERTVEERTHDLRIEKERTEKAKEVIEAQADKLRELDRFKTRFFANLSHEFRTPLTMIIGPLENLISGAYGSVSEAAVRQGHIMLRNAQRLLRLINQLLDLSKLEAGKMELRSRERNIVPFVEGIVYSCLPLAETKKIALNFTSDIEQAPLHFEPDKLEKVFFNLLSNALKFTPAEGTIDVTVTDLPTPTAAMREGAIQIAVRDTGKGIPEGDLPHVFDRFHQVDGSNTREHEGTGIGLALVQELVLLHKGEIEVESTLGVGTTFTVRFPKGKAHLKPEEIAVDSDIPEAMLARGALTELAIEGADLDHEPPAEAGDTPAPVAKSDKLVLVVEDNPDVREYVAGILEATYRVITAVDGVDGLDKARTQMPDLIVSDVMMPRMDGNEMCRRLKEDPRFNHIPIMLLTARATNDLRIEGLEARADDFLAKPFNARELMTRVANLLILREQEKELKRLNEHLEVEVANQLELILSERLKYEAELLVAKEEAERSSRLKSSILDNVNHEFRTPIAGIVGSSDLLAMEVPEDLRELVDIIKISADRLMRTLNAVVELGALESESYVLHPYQTDVLDVLEEVLEQQFVRARSKDLDLQYQVNDESLPAVIDPMALRRVFELIIDNAIKFTTEGSINVHVESDSDVVQIRVQDTGVGMDAEFMQHVFEAFVQESNGMTRDYEGCGIGLTIAHRLIDKMGGQIRIESEKGVGSTFTVEIPARAGKSLANTEMVYN